MKTYTFHTFNMGDCDDPEIYAAIPLGEFMQTEKGIWIKKHCPDPQYIIRSDNDYFGFKVSVYGPLEDIHATEFLLRWHTFSN